MRDFLPWLPEHFHFLHPGWLWLLLLLPLLLLLIHWRQHRRQAVQQLADSQLLPYLLVGKKRLGLGQLLLITLIWLLAVLALAGPVWQQYPVPLQESRKAQVIAVSLSQEMYADDVSSSRMELARFKAQDLLKENAAGENGLIGFSGQTFVVAPLTRDSHSLSALLAAMNPSTMPVEGHNAAAAIKQAQTLLLEAGAPRGLIILITSKANKQAIHFARLAHRKGLRVSVLGIGTDKQQPVRLPNGKLLHDKAGNLVLTKRNDSRLAAIARAGGGHYVKASDGKAAIQTLENDLRGGRHSQSRKIRHWRDMGPWLLIPLILLLALVFRRGWLLLLMLMPLAFPHPAQAASWQQHWHNLWQRPDQQAAAALKNGDTDKADKLAQSPGWKGSAAYKAKNYGKAINAFQKYTGPDAKYNLGNALAKNGQLKEAVSAYKEALQNNPDNSDAKTNLARVEKHLKQQQKQQHSGKGHHNKNKNKQNKKRNNQSHNQKQGNHSNKGEKPSQKGNKKPNKRTDKKQKDRNQRRKSSASHQQNQSAKQSHSKSQASKKGQQKRDEKANKARRQSNKAKEKRQQKAVNDLGAINKQDPLQKLPADKRQLLMVVPDKPGALLKRKFKLEYEKRKNNGGPQ